MPLSMESRSSKAGSSQQAARVGKMSGRLSRRAVDGGPGREGSRCTCRHANEKKRELGYS